MQGTLGRRHLWEARSVSTLVPWSVSQEAAVTGGSEVAVAVSVSHDVLADVRAYVNRHLPKVGRILAFSALPGPGPAVVRDADHALSLAQALALALRTERTAEERRETVHLFVAGPAGFSFLLGQQAQSFGLVVVYEYDFESNAPGAYEPGIRLPEKP